MEGLLMRGLAGSASNKTFFALLASFIAEAYQEFTSRLVEMRRPAGKLSWFVV